MINKDTDETYQFICNCAMPDTNDNRYIVKELSLAGDTLFGKVQYAFGILNFP